VIPPRRVRLALALAMRLAIGFGAGSLVFDWPFGISTSDVQARAMRAYGIHAVRADCSKRPYVKVGTATSSRTTTLPVSTSKRPTMTES
jgi:hypothetical protein